MGASALQIFGIRHHGPGSARSLRRALEELQPDCVLVEGPSDAGAVLEWMLHEQMKPPVALLGYVPDAPRQAAYYPFAHFSPEWQALRYGLERKITLRFMDLPFAVQLAMDEEKRREEAAAKAAEAIKAKAAPAGEEACATEAMEKKSEPHPRHDPLLWLAEAAGYSDSERWWEHMVEERRQSSELFGAIREALTALRKELPPLEDAKERRREEAREACMRTVIREAQKEGFKRIAVVCGAWHAPELDPQGHPAADDAARLKGLPSTKVKTTWIPWTYGRLSASSGYGAGVASPGWYEHLWLHEDRIAEHWLTRVARLLRGEDLEASSAQTIEAVRLAEALASLRGRPLPGLPEMNEAVQAIFCLGSDLPLRLIHDKLIVGEVLGAVPESTPIVPLQQDLEREQKRLRLPPQASQESVEFDLRKESDLDRSRLLHRLNLLGVPWGETQRARGKGTFKEGWRLQWKPEFAVALIDAARWGNTVREASSARAIDGATTAADLPSLTRLLERVFLCDLPEAAERLMVRLQAVSAVAADVSHLMDALPPLADVLRYGNVRQTDAQMVAGVVDGLVARTCVGLPVACGSLNDEAAAEMFGRIERTHAAITLLEQDNLRTLWKDVLKRLADLPNLHGLIAGRAVRLLFDAAALPAEEAARRLSLALSVTADPAPGAAWIDGFLRGSGQILIHDERLLQVLDAWVAGLPPDAFVRVLPLLRRTFSTFPAPERRNMGERLKRGTPPGQKPGHVPEPDREAFDAARAEAVLPLVRLLLGLGAP
ncbi:MAG: hypothetical protein HY291_19705 [Planctomycetes bacterium]|nr:hypothetical protein [Planctomycetota bacterium]